MAPTLFCCNAISAFRPQYLSHESKFTSFKSWATFPRESMLNTLSQDNTDLAEINPPFAIQLVRQVNYGAIEWIKYFIPASNTSNEFVEVVEDDLIQANFQKLNSYKNFKCEFHDKFFELNIYQKDPINKHHWRANMARPARDIDLSLRAGLPQAGSMSTTPESRAHEVGDDKKKTIDSKKLGDDIPTGGQTKRMPSAITEVHESPDSYHDVDDEIPYRSRFSSHY